MGIEVISLIVELSLYMISIGVAYGKLVSRLRALETKMDKYNIFAERIIVLEHRLLELRRLFEEQSFRNHERERKYEN